MSLSLWYKNNKNDYKIWLMKRITSITELKSGDKIICPKWDKLVIRIFVQPLNGIVKDSLYSIMLDENYDGVPKFFNENLAMSEWYLWETTADYYEIRARQCELMEERLHRFKERVIKEREEDQ